MSKADNSLTGTTAVRKNHLFDEFRLETWLKDNISDYAGPLKVEQFKGGQSNPTYKLITPTRNYVLRRKPPGEILKGAHAIEREAKILSALGSVNFPVAHVYALCTDESVIGTWFYVMEMVEGRIFWDVTFPSVDHTDRPLYFDAMNDTLSKLHLVDFNSIGLSDYSRTGNYFERQIARWSRQYLEDAAAGRDPDMDKLLEWLPAHIPPNDETSIVHGDFRCDNLIFDATRPKIIAVLDWELSTLGHPLADFSYHLMMYRMPPSMFAGLEGVDLKTLNIPSEEEYVATYCRRSGRVSIEHLDFYIAFNMFRFTAILHGIKGRMIRGTAASDQAKDAVSMIPLFAERAWKLAENAPS